MKSLTLTVAILSLVVLAGCDRSSRAGFNDMFCNFLLEQKAKTVSSDIDELIYLVSMEEVFAFPACYDKKLISVNGAIKIMSIDGSVWLFQDKDRARAESFNTAMSTGINREELINPNVNHFKDDITMGSATGRFRWDLEPPLPLRWLKFDPVLVIRVDERRGDETSEFDDRLYYLGPETGK